MKRRGNRRYYQHHEVLLIRRIRGLLYEQGFTISGARNRLVEPVTGLSLLGDANPADEGADIEAGDQGLDQPETSAAAEATAPTAAGTALSPAQVRLELMSIRGLLTL